MGNTTSNLPHKKKKLDKYGRDNGVIDKKNNEDPKNSTINGDIEYQGNEHEWIRYLPQELLFEILEFAELPPATIIRYQLLSKYWNAVFKSNGVWRLICKQRGFPSIYFKSDTENSVEHWLRAQEKREDFGRRTLNLMRTANIPGQPFVLVGRVSTDESFDINTLSDLITLYDRHFKNQWVHPNLAVQKIFGYKDKEEYFVCCEPANDYLIKALVTQPYLVSEANICEIIKQILSAMDWLNERKIYSYHLDLENFWVNVSSDDKIEVKFYSALFDFSGRRPGYGNPGHIPPEILWGNDCTDKSYSWMIGWIAFVLLTGEDPFQRETIPQTFEAILRAQFEFADPTDNHVTPLARDFISKLLNVDQSTRMTVKQALQHEWICSSNKSTIPMLNVVKGYSKLT